MELNFDWDDAKAQENLRKHRVSFAEAQLVFNDDLSITIPDPRHAGEARWVITGVGLRGRLLVVVYTQRGDKIRLISARLATPAERRKYEEDSD